MHGASKGEGGHQERDYVRPVHICGVRLEVQDSKDIRKQVDVHDCGSGKTSFSNSALKLQSGVGKAVYNEMSYDPVAIYGTGTKVPVNVKSSQGVLQQRCRQANAKLGGDQSSE